MIGETKRAACVARRTGLGAKLPDSWVTKHVRKPFGQNHYPLCQEARAHDLWSIVTRPSTATRFTCALCFSCKQFLESSSSFLICSVQAPGKSLRDVACIDVWSTAPRLHSDYITFTSKNNMIPNWITCLCSTKSISRNMN